MEFQDVLRHRRMVRTFESRSVPDATLHRLLRMARRAPSAGHTQPLELVVVRDPEVRQGLAAAAWSRRSRPDAGEATVVFCGDLRREAERYGIRDASAECLQPFFVRDGSGCHSACGQVPATL